MQAYLGRPVYSLMMGTRLMIVLNSDQAVKDLLDKRSNIYSSRPDLYLPNIISGSLRVVLMAYGETWRMIHRIYHNMLHVRSATAFIPYQDLENKQMMRGLLDSPDEFVDHIRRYTNSLTTQMVFGFRTFSNDDPKLKQLYYGFDKMVQVLGSTSAAFLDLYPALRELPDFLVPMRRYCKDLHAREKELYVSHWLDAKARISNGTSKPCFCVDLVKAQKVEAFSDGLAAYISGSLLEAGSDTTAAQLVGFVQAMVLFPEVQKAAQRELDKVCGDRLPTLDDKLPYIRCCVKECLRWMPTAILGIPHSVIREDEYMGYRIPKGCNVMLNVWAIHMDPKRHSNPRAFDPTRYEGDLQTAAEATANADASKRDHFGFGAGRRVCQGIHIAERSLTLGIARLLWAFQFRRAVDSNGRETVPDPEDLTQGVLVQPRPFPVKIVPRSEAHACALREAWDSCQVLLDGEKQWKEVPEGMPFSTYTPE
ncbi:uncharacterized protein JN550_001180 [Neoarthrinium moseri]|uniref:uncharacterized protein n=1 Tax=Neoarthrinium moseri TaxID=1658444 RepID=UPI001FDB8849|nr:uncharacterized protein JN550_001180 [Neoarthrinium moseri]KAI1877108.1 hypothetical protein JN550_001180 [Neoarthrinium moseri]